MQVNKAQLIAELLSLTQKSITAVNRFKTLKISQLNFKSSAQQWSILECVEHLNLYGDFYLPEMQKQLLNTTYKGNNLIFKSGIIGNYFADLMKIKNGKIKKIKSPKNKNPVNSALTITTINRFLKQQELLKIILQQALATDICKIKTAISLSKFIKLRLGDTFRFYVYHVERHIIQAEKIIA